MGEEEVDMQFDDTIPEEASSSSNVDTRFAVLAEADVQITRQNAIASGATENKSSLSKIPKLRNPPSPAMAHGHLAHLRHIAP